MQGSISFKPTEVIDSEKFIGRKQEILQLENGLKNTVLGNGGTFIIFGKSGIGKTSLLKYIEKSSSNHGNFFSIFIDLSNDVNADNVIEVLENEISSKFKKLARDIRDTLNSFQVTTPIGGLQYSGHKKDDAFIKRKQSFFKNYLKFMKLNFYSSNIPQDRFDGFIIILDNAEQIKDDAVWSFLRELIKQNDHLPSNKLSLYIAGISVENPKWIKGARNVSIHPLDNLNRDEIISDLPQKYFKENGEIIITVDATNLLYSLSKGHPYFLQKIGFWCQQFNMEKEINASIVLWSIFHPLNFDSNFNIEYNQEKYKYKHEFIWLEENVQLALKNTFKKYCPFSDPKYSTFLEQFYKKPIDLYEFYNNFIDLRWHEWKIKFYLNEYFEQTFKLKIPELNTLQYLLYDQSSDWQNTVLEYLLDGVRPDWITLFTQFFLQDFPIYNIIIDLELDSDDHIALENERKWRLLIMCEILRPLAHLMDYSVKLNLEEPIKNVHNKESFIKENWYSEVLNSEYYLIGQLICGLDFLGDRPASQFTS